MLGKFQLAAGKIGQQAQAFGQQVAREAQDGSQKALTGFKLENEVSAIHACHFVCELTRALLCPAPLLTTAPPHSAPKPQRSCRASSPTLNTPNQLSTRSPRKFSHAQRGTYQFHSASQLLDQFVIVDALSLSLAFRSVPRSYSFAIFTVFKAGFVWSGKAGSGIVIARLEDGSWSAPSCIATGGVGFGLQIGADLSEVSVAFLSFATHADTVFFSSSLSSTLPMPSQPSLRAAT